MRTTAVAVIGAIAWFVLVTEARQPAGRGDATWNRRAPGAGDYRIVAEVSGREELALFLEPPSKPEDLQSVCTQTKEAALAAIRTHETRLASLASKDGDSPAMAWTNKSLGQLWSYQGQMERAIEYFEAAYRTASLRGSTDPEFRAARPQLEILAGVAHLRRGELENCVHGHGVASCILPISAAGRHQLKSGSQNAIRYFTRYLAQHRDDLDIRWLLNIAHMTLGTYPKSVPPAYLIPPAALESGEQLAAFIDIAPRLRLAAPGVAGGAVVDDLNNDGLLDVVVSSVDACEPLHYYRQQTDGTFRDVMDETGLNGQLGGINLTQADYNNDGRLDLFVMRGGWQYPIRNSLLRHNADGTFTDVTREAGLSRSRHRTHTAAWADFDNDGRLDLFVGHEETPSSLFRNQGNGTFVDVGRAAGVAQTAFTKGATWGDYDNDGYPDLYVSNYAGENFLYHNEGNGTFTERAKTAGVDKPVMSFPTWFFDYDNDGWLDLFVASYVPSVTEVVKGFLHLPRNAETMKLYRNTGKGTFDDVTASAGLDRVIPTMGANFGDIDNDGYLDLYLGTGAPSYAALMPNFLFRNRSGKTFVDVTTATGTGHLQKGHGVAFADIDRDGDLDIFENIGGLIPGDAYNRVLFQNPHSGRSTPLNAGNNWIRVRLVGSQTNRAAIGAKITVRLDDGSIRYREVTSGGSFGASPLAQHIGLGRAAKIATLEISWPVSGARQTLRDVAVNQEIEIRETGERASR